MCRFEKGLDFRLAESESGKNGRVPESKSRLEYYKSACLYTLVKDSTNECDV